jgi:hypothetical protein
MMILVGDVFASPDWVNCTCSFVTEEDLYQCSTVCLEYYRDGGGMYLP